MNKEKIYSKSFWEFQAWLLEAKKKRFIEILKDIPKIIKRVNDKKGR